ncbi:hypothetical protein, conserved [Trypanosoma brucei brucei TREU927]|uniref:T. brucei spp.-specific protein n=1 Tax=Trypanosoma brucei brucei (strain 927/4 GUTat10.1) TaxID=185431 RepID=Q4GZB4_TRYB2|nr:hypothetical protein, conserved [Trypanosoma brucei brucei TREU927]CAJ16037.1 hypothetical protein, conserved [Trypanosoma brucei brucei TREU927]
MWRVKPLVWLAARDVNTLRTVSSLHSRTRQEDVTISGNDKVTRNRERNYAAAPSGCFRFDLPTASLHSELSRGRRYDVPKGKSCSGQWASKGKICTTTNNGRAAVGTGKEPSMGPLPSSRSSGTRFPVDYRRMKESHKVEAGNAVNSTISSSDSRAPSKRISVRVIALE